MDRTGAALNRDFSTREITLPEGKLCKSAAVTGWLLDCDGIINFAKLKSHGMMGLSAAAKNLFGTIPGTMKPEYHFRFPNARDFADMIVQIDRYCKKRGVPFLFVFEPEKLSVMREFAPVGMNYDDSWVDEFLDILDQNGVDYVDNTVILTQKHREGIPVFNRQYDAGHWNDIGAFYGVNCILEGMQRRCPQIKLNTEDEFSIGEKQERDLQQNGVMVEEKVPEYKPKVKPEVLTKKYKEGLKLDPSYRYFYYSKRDDKQSPKTLMFQGSYMNTRGYKFMANALNEYIAVHDYQNIFDFEYYYEKFKPEYVVFEVAEYTFLDLYFNTEKLKGFSPE